MASGHQPVGRMEPPHKAKAGPSRNYNWGDIHEVGLRPNWALRI